MAFRTVERRMFVPHFGMVVAAARERHRVRILRMLGGDAKPGPSVLRQLWECWGQVSAGVLEERLKGAADPDVSSTAAGPRVFSCPLAESRTPSWRCRGM